MFFAWLLAAGLALPAWAREAVEEPQWESGLGVAALRIPDYRGSDKLHTYLLPLPYLVYRGDIVKVDKEGAHADIFRSEHVKLDLSFSAGPPSESTEDGARSGMPDIDPTVEAGPVLKVLLGASADRNHVVTLRMPWRAVLTLPHFDYIGWNFTPHLNYDAFELGASRAWNFGLSFGPVYGSERYHDYYYQVDPQYATATRPAYDAKGGYSGMQYTAALSRRYPKFWLGTFVRYDDLSGAKFEDSPVVRKKESLMFGVGISWVFAKSAKTVRVEPELLP